MSRVDLLHPDRPPWLGWVVLALGTLALIAAVGLRQHWQRLQTSAQERALKELRAQQEAKVRTAKPALPAPDLARQQRLGALVARPWLQTLRAIEAAMAPSIYILGLSIDPAAGLVRIEAEAAGFDRMLNYLQMLEARPELQAVQLRSHEPMVGSDPASHGLKFTVTAQWAQP
jgi:hypothetical protein